MPGGGGVRKLSGLKEGPAVLRVVARDRSYWNLFRGNEAVVEKNIAIDVTPPTIELIADGADGGGHDCLVQRREEHARHQTDQDRHQHERAPVARTPPDQGECGIAAEHVEIAVRQIDDVEQPEDHGEPQSHERQRNADDQRVDDLGRHHEMQIGKQVFHREARTRLKRDQNLSHLSGPTATSPGTVPTVWKSLPFTFTTTMSTTA
mgnify:CR=1 FL=1